MKSKLKVIIPIGIAIIAIALAFVFIRFTPAQKADIKAIISTAQQYITEQKFEQAIAEFKKAIEIDPMNVDAYIGIAQAYEAIGDTGSALEWLHKGYDLTGDSSLKAEIDRISRLAEEVVTAAAETSYSEMNDVSLEENNKDYAEECLSYIVPYKHTSTSTSRYFSQLFNRAYDNIFMSSSCNDEYLSLINMYKNIMTINPNPTVLSDVSPRICIDGCSITYNLHAENYNKYKPSIIMPIIKIDDLNGANIYRVENEYNNEMQVIAQKYINDGEIVLTEYFDYDNKGRIVSKKSKYKKNDFDFYEYQHLHPVSQILVESDTVITNYEYDSNDNLIKAIWDSGRFQYKYDANGNCIEEVYIDDEFFSQYGKELVIYTYEYHPNGNIFKINMLSDSKIIEHYIFDESGNIIEYNHNNGGGFQCFNEHGHLISSGYYLDDDNMTKHISTTYENKYDDKSRLVEVKETTESGYVTMYYYIYDNNKLMEKIEDHTDLYKFRTIYEYNSNNQVISETEYNSTKSWESGVWEEREYTKVEYEYNSEGVICKSVLYEYGENIATDTCTKFAIISLPKSFVDEVLG